MNRVICLILTVLLLSSLCGCHFGKSADLLEPVEFCYPRRSDAFIYSADDGVLGTEMREASGHKDDLNYLLSMYLRGPQDNNLRSPFPDGCKLEEVRHGGNTVCLVLSAEFAALENVELTLACASLTKTCLGLTDASRIRIDAVSETKTVSITMDAKSLLLADYSAFENPQTPEEP